MTAPASYREISRDEYMDMDNRWHQYRTARTREDAAWMAERLPSASDAEYAVVDRGSFYTIAVRYIGEYPE